MSAASGTAYRYRVASVLRVVDADTVDLVIDVGFHLSAALRFRVLGVDAPERGHPAAAEATAFTRAWLAEPGSLTAHTRKADSFGRWLADIEREGGGSLSQALLDAGHAVPRSR